MSFPFKGGGGGGSKVRKVGNMISRLQVTQKFHQECQIFGGVLSPQTHRGRGATPLFRAKKSKCAIKAKKHQSIDSKLLSSHNKIHPDWSKMAELWPKKRMPLYGIIFTFRDFVAYLLAKYQYFSMKSSLFV